MSAISGINSSQNLQELYALLGVQSVSNTTAQDSTQSILDSFSSAGATFEKSKPGEVLNKLAQLQESDPEKFKQVTAEIAEKLKAAAKEMTGTEAERISDLADKFQQASETGDLSVLQPPPPPSGGRGYGPPPPLTDTDQSSTSGTQTTTNSATGGFKSPDDMWASILTIVNQAMGA
jgi:hypothetical protein